MFKRFIKQIFIRTVVIGVLLSTANSAHAAYEVVSAKTVGNENLKQPKENTYRPTYNDPELPEVSPDSYVVNKIEKKLSSFFDKRKQNRETSEDIIEQEVIKDADSLEIEEDEEDLSVEEGLSVGEDLSTEEDIDTEEILTTKKVSNTKKATSAKNKTVVDNKNRFQINADKITYDDTEGNVYAKGNVEIISKEQNVILKADDAVLDKESQTIKLHNNVKIIKEGTEMVGEYMLVDLNEQNILMDNPTLEAYSFVIKAQEGYLVANDIQMLNGNMKSSRRTEYPFATNGFCKLDPRGARALYDSSVDTSEITPTKKQVYTIDSKEIVITSYRDHNSVLLKGSNIYYNNHKIVRNSDIEIITDKENQIFETNMAEAGSMRNFGTYVGYGFVFRLPEGQTLKLMPALVYKSGLGVGVIGRYQTRNGNVEAGWASASSDLIVRGRYRLSDSLNLRYARRSYISEGFFGSRRPGYGAQLEYKKSYVIDDLKANFDNGVYVGLFSDYKKKHQEKDVYSTTRFRYMAQLSKKILQYENEEQDLRIAFRANLQGAATLYGSGETTGVIRFGPSLRTSLKRWDSNIGYYFAGMHGDSPFRFDKYRYGKSSIYLNEKFNFNNKFALGYRVTVTPLKDNYEDKLLTESRLYAMFGPQDLKVALSYDFVRDIAHLDFMFLIGSDSAKINFDKLTTKNMDGGQEKRDFYKRPKRIKIEEKSEML